LKKYIIHILGIAILTLGIAGIITVELGAAPIDAFNVFMHNLITKNITEPKITLGMVAITTGVLIVILNFIMKPDKEIFISVIFLFFIGLFIDLWKLGFSLIPNEILFHIVIRIIISFLSLNFIAIGTAISITTGVPAGPYEKLLIVINRKITNINLAKTAIEAFFFVLALITGLIANMLFKQVNIMTFLIIILSGPLTSFYVSKIRNNKKEVNELELKQND
jgi:uncharacterized membrane protein YczE